MARASIALNQQMLPVFLGLMAAAAAGWLFLSSRLYTVLRNEYPGVYETLGRPGLFMRRSLAANIGVMGFLLRRGYQDMDDPSVHRICQGLRSLLYIYLLCFAGCVILLIDKFL